MAKSFVHLHVHSQHSLLDAIATSDEMAKLASRDNMPALALTDHGNLAGSIEHYKVCKERGVDPLLGAELYVAENDIDTPRSKHNKTHHLTAIAYNNKGWKNLIKIVSHAHLHGFSWRPRASKRFIREHAEGIIALSGCQSSQFCRRILDGDKPGALATIEEMQSIFGKDNFYLETMRINNPRQMEVERMTMDIYRQTGIPIVATNDLHWCYPDQYDLHDTVICMQSKTPKSVAKRMRYDTKELYWKTSDQMRVLFRDLPEACDNTLLIAERCALELELGKMRQLPFDDTIPADQRIDVEVRRGFNERYGENAKAKERLEYEMRIIKQMGFSSYFLILWDLVKFCRENRIPVGSGRGSAAGSIVSFCLGITDIDPLKYDLIFERFLQPERASMPDIDLDVCQARRGEVLRYLRKKYGQDNVAKIGTVNRMMAKTVVREVGKFKEVPIHIVEDIARLIPEGSITLNGLKNTDAAFARAWEDNKEFLDDCAALEGMPSHMGTHAAAMVISDVPIDEIVPLTRDREGHISTQYSMEHVEDMGLLKLDVLGLKTLSILDLCTRFVEEIHGIPYEETYDKSRECSDPNVYGRIFVAGDTLGIFQFETAGMRSYLRSLEPDCLTDLAAMNCLYRPGPLVAGMCDKYISRKHGRETADPIDPRVADKLAFTYQLPIYQEEIMWLAQEVAGFSLTEGYMLIKAIGKKLPEKMHAMKDSFVSGCVSGGLNKESSQALFDIVEGFAGYSFNLSHSICYSELGYRCAWYKHHYPAEFMAANMSFEGHSDGKLQEFMHECVKKGIKLLPPDVNKSDVRCTVEDGAVRIGLSLVRGVGKGFARSIVDKRPPSGYRSIAEVALGK